MLFKRHYTGGKSSLGVGKPKDASIPAFYQRMEKPCNRNWVELPASNAFLERPQLNRGASNQHRRKPHRTVPPADLPFRRLLPAATITVMRYSLKTLLLIVTMLCVVPGGWIAYKRQRAANQRGAVEALDKLGVRFGYVDDSKRPWYLPEVLDDRRFDTVTSIDCTNSHVKDKDLVHLEQLPGITELDLQNRSVTDAGLRHLRRLRNLRELRLDQTLVTDQGLRQLQDLSQLRSLSLVDTAITDQGIKNIEQLSELEDLDLIGTQITPAGFSRLQSLQHLQNLCVPRNVVTPESIARFNEAVPEISIFVE
jgi:hypothetical protein